MDDMSGMDEIIREFLVESTEALDHMDADLVELEKDPDSRELLARIFRAIHTIKGTSGVLGFPKVESVAHVGENLLSRMRDGKLKLNPELTTVLLAMVDALRALLGSIEGSGAEGDRDCSEVIKRITECMERGSAVSRADCQDSEPGASTGPIGEILVRCGVSGEAVAEALVQQSEGDPRRIGEILVARGDAKPEAVLEALTTQAGGRSASVSSNIRVDVGLLDKVMNLVGELVLARNQIPASAVRVNNVASVFVTASLPPFARSGTRIDITVSSIGDAKSLEGGILLLTPLHAADGQTYAAAQGPLVLGGYTAGLQGSSKQVNHPTVARIPEGGTVERDAAVDLAKLPTLSLLLANADFSVARDIVEVINREFRRNVAHAVDSRRIDLDPEALGRQELPAALARLEALQVPVHPKPRVVLNERTGTVVMGSDVRLSAVSILHGNLSIEISTQFKASQPAPFSQGETVVVPQPSVRAQESPVKRIELADGANVEELVNGLRAIGATTRDVVAIIQAIKAAGALQAELEVI